MSFITSKTYHHLQIHNLAVDTCLHWYRFLLLCLSLIISSASLQWHLIKVEYVRGFTVATVSQPIIFSEQAISMALFETLHPNLFVPIIHEC